MLTLHNVLPSTTATVQSAVALTAWSQVNSRLRTSAAAGDPGTPEEVEEEEEVENQSR